jgi:hypothetical protein
MVLLLGWLVLAGWSRPARGDGGLLRLAETAGDYRITVFTSPTPLRPGWVDISILVQDALSGQTIPDAMVTVRMAQGDQPVLEYPATTEAATNKLFRAAQFELPMSGRWEVQVQVDGSHGKAVVRCELEAAERLPRWREIWPWMSWPALAIALFTIHQVLTRRPVGSRIGKPEPKERPQSKGRRI